MIIKKGIGVNIGIAIGKAYVLPDEDIVVEKRKIPREQIKNEVARYRHALLKTKEELDLLKEQILTSLGKQHAKLIDAHTMILRDPLISKDVVNLIISEGINAEYALTLKIEKILKKFDNIKDTFFLERKNEIIDVSRRILFNFLNTKPTKLKELKDIKEPIILVANNIYPADLINIRKIPNIIAFCTNTGSKTSHTAIFATNTGMPAVVGLGDITKIVKSGDFIIVNGEDGSVIISPTDEMIDLYTRKKEKIYKDEQFLLKLKKLSTVTRDNKRVTLMINLEGDDDLNEYKTMNSDGVGLFRTEFLYLNRDRIPAEYEQCEIYKKILQTTPNLNITIRTADIGADKISGIGFKETVPNLIPLLVFGG